MSDPNYLLGQWLAAPPPGDEVVISGMAGKFPDSDNMHEFFENVLSKKDMISEEGRRWTIDHPEIPQRAGNIYDIDKIDAGYFGLHYRQANNMDSLMRLVMESVIESILDAGVNPAELAGTRTGVFFSVLWSETENDTLRNASEPQQFLMTGYLRSLIARRISYFLKLKGPCYTLDTACSSSLYAFDHAFRALRSGVCDKALIVSGQLLLNPLTTLQFYRMGVIGMDGRSKVFDQAANGYVRAETIASVFLQKFKDSRRNYCQVINSKLNSDGFKDSGLLFPSIEGQRELMTEIYDESGLQPSDIRYLEAHGTGTTVGDLQEVISIDLALAQRRQEPLLVGSVKSNMGHSEPASGLGSLAKILLAMETGKIAPNINLKQFKKGMAGFFEGRMVPVLDITELKGEDAIVGVNNFGFGGSNVHIILKRFNKTSKNIALSEDELPILVGVSGRTEDAVLLLLNDLKNKKLNRDYIALLHQTYKNNIPGHIHRGFVVLKLKQPVKISSDISKQQTPSLYIFFGNFQAKANSLGKGLLPIPIFKSTMQRVNNILKKFDVLEAISKNSKKIEENVVVSVLVQLGIVVLLQEINLEFKAIYEDSVGKLITAFHHNIITLEEAVLAVSSKNFAKTKILQSSKIENLRHDSLKHQKLVINISDDYVNNGNLTVADSNTFLEILGNLYVEGFNFDIHKLYPDVEFPVSRGTSMVSPLVKWNHKKSWKSYKYSQFSAVDREIYSLNPNDEHKYLDGHVINGRNLVPATEYLYLVWQSFAYRSRLQVKNTPVIFENCKFIKATTVPKTGFLNFLVAIQRGTGDFEVLENDQLVVSGRILQAETEHSVDDESITELTNERREVLDQDEIYRELHIRGYNYSGMFKGLVKCNAEASSGLIKWENNWTSFMDTMLQIKILQMDTRMLYVPTAIKKLIIDPVKHLKTVENLAGQEETLMPACVHRESNVIKSGGIEIRGLQAKSIAKRKDVLEPVLEKYEFVPTSSTLATPQAIRVDIQIILENTAENNFKAVEIIDEFTDSESEYLLPFVCNSLDDTPLINPVLTLSTKETIEDIPGVKTEQVVLTPQSNFLLMIGSRILQRLAVLKTFSTALNAKGFLLSRENVDFVFDASVITDMELFSEYNTGKEKLILLKKREPEDSKIKFVKIDEDLDWLPRLQNALAEQDTRIVVYGNNTHANGILGLTNALKKEINASKVQCFFTFDQDFGFDLENFSRKTQMSINIFKGYKRGTYRHLVLKKNKKVVKGHSFVDTTVTGNLSSLAWHEGFLSKQTPLAKNNVLIDTYYSALNFKDIMMASGRIGVDIVSTNRLEQECTLGFEFSGRDTSGRRVAGMVSRHAIATMLVADKTFMWNVPDHWTLEDAATVPAVYATVAYALLLVAKLKRGASILIHSATGGIGLAAINICRHFNCEMFLTVGTLEKRDYIRKHFPEIPDDHVGNSHDTSFEETIKRATKSRGVDIVLNSLTEDKLKATVRCLARGGHFLEIGKFDLGNDAALDLLFIEKEISYNGVMLDQIFANSETIKKQIHDVIEEGIKIGFVKPLPRVIFKPEEVEQAFRYMTLGKHIGKVLIQIRDEKEKTSDTNFEVIPRFNCDVTKTYVLIGGLGGFGLELADWLMLRGAKKIILSSRTGIQSGYQTQRIRIWESHGVTVRVATDDVTTQQGCTNLMEQATSLGPVDGVFNLAAVVQDALLENLTPEMFKAALAPKALVTKHLDVVTRKLCPQLRHFVTFSSVSCGRGNAGQTNYAMANSVMERICEKRKREGLPGLAIQWGVIGDVGLVMKMQKENKELVIGGTLQQKISSCLEVLDTFLTQDNPVVASMVVAMKNNRSLGIATAVEAVAAILGIKDLKMANHHATLAELGMDSMMSTEIIQVLEKDFEIYLTGKEVRALTLAQVTEIEGEKDSEKKKSNKAKSIKSIIQYMVAQDCESRNSSIVMKIPSQVNDRQITSTVFIFPGVEGALKPLETFYKKLKAHVFGVQYCYGNPEDSIEDIAANILPQIESHLPENKTFSFVGYSFGVEVGLEVVHLLENKGYNGRFVAIDGSPTYSSLATKTYFQTESEAEFETLLIYSVLKIILPEDILLQNKEKILQCQSFKERINLGLALIPEDVMQREQLEEQGMLTLYKRFKAVIKYEYIHDKIKADVHLIKAKFPMVVAEEDYGFSKICQKSVNITVVDGDHESILEQNELVSVVNKLIQ